MKRQEGVCVCAWICTDVPRVPVCVRHLRGLGLFLRIPAPGATCLHELAPRACLPSSWQRTAGPGGCACARGEVAGA